MNEHEIGEIPMNFEFEGVEIVACCPFCREELNYPTSVSVLPAGEDPDSGQAIVSSSGIFVEKGIKPKGRGVLIEVEMRCEMEPCPPWKLVIRFHKGNTFLSKEPVKLEKAGNDEGVIWRT